MSWKRFSLHRPFLRGLLRSPASQSVGPSFDIVVVVGVLLNNQSICRWFDEAMALIWGHCNVMIWLLVVGLKSYYIYIDSFIFAQNSCHFEDDKATGLYLEQCWPSLLTHSLTSQGISELSSYMYVTVLFVKWYNCDLCKFGTLRCRACTYLTRLYNTHTIVLSCPK